MSHSINNSEFNDIYYQNVNFNDDSSFYLESATRISPPHFHSAVELVYILDGNTEFNCNGENFNACKGDIVVINSNAVHSFNLSSPKADYFFIMVDEKFLRKNNLYSVNTLFNNKINEEVSCYLFEKIIQENKEKDNFKNASITANIMSLFVHINRNHLSKNKENKLNIKKLNVVRATLDYIHNNYKDKIKIDDLAKQLYFSKSYLSHTFKEITNYTIVDYTNLIRCRAAKALINNGSEINEAALSCGFIDISYFTRVFKKTLGMLPSAVRAKHSPSQKK